MNKNGFVQIITHYHEINPQALKSLQALQSKYPYSEAIHAMIAKGASLQNGKSGKELTIAALYSTDRSILKSVLVEKASLKPAAKVLQKKTTEPTKTPSKTSSSTPKITTPTTRTPKPAAKASSSTVEKKKIAVVKQPVRKSPQEGVSSEEHEKEMDALRNELFLNLEELRKSKSYLMELFDHSDTVQPKGKKTSTSGKKKAEPKKSPKRKTVISSAKKETKTDSPASKQVKPVSTKSVKPKTPSDPIIDDSENNDDESIDNGTLNTLIENLENKRKEENQKADENGDQSDLSVPSVEFGDDLVSENLAKIMIKQGKKEKAIDIYKKLIWKFPQKKAYFASQIENLKEE